MDDKAQADDMAQLAEQLHAAASPAATAEQVVRYACRELEADHGGITLVRRGNTLQTIAATDPLVVRLDQLQQAFGRGPCEESAIEQETIFSADLGIDRRWGDWGPAAATLGIISVLATRLRGVDGRGLGALNLFWTRAHAFDSEDIAFAALFSRHAAVALEDAQIQEGLRTALDARKRIGQAQGILMERYRLDPEQAFEALRRFSQEHNLKLRAVADHLVTQRKLPAGD
ncbi:GAF and ANTAR domain-containing protein [Calidifontibacter sp. DB0510]|uniref:GAF and ANTAR domain-containing protein n=1 Tax=Metallococcus carri TaxID=1656884 RepID=A0A967B4U5_9MICO|nr:GAF and ANTAR domain-containing protein [Metallococcus carri]NHN54656.1 GAF and ANTAR domain-containing protein [Metallococcus carri]NOP37001.1 GAF and ANTAR domain-containing protein [Calidifontibacter sp. DB2511S]